MKEEKYLIAWSGKGQCFYGKDQDNHYDWVDGLTLKQAKNKLKDFPQSNGRQKLVIYKLVPIKN